MEVQEQVADVEGPGLGAVDVGAFVGGAEDVVEDYVEGDEGGEAVEGGGDCEFGELVMLV